MIKHETIAIRAYQKWLNAGSPICDGKDFWYAAEKEITEEKKTTLKQELKPHPQTPQQSVQTWMGRVRQLLLGKTKNT